MPAATTTREDPEMHPGLPHDWDAANGPGIELGDEARASLRRDLADNHEQVMAELIWRSDRELVELHATLHAEEDRALRHARLEVRRADEAARDAREREITERAARNRRGYPR
jgi:hypothetical protein